MVGLDDADVIDALRIEFLDGLIDQGQRQHREDHALAGIQRLAGDRARDDGFAIPGRRFDHDAAATGLDGLVDLINQVLLLGAECRMHRQAICLWNRRSVVRAHPTVPTKSAI